MPDFNQLQHSRYKVAIIGGGPAGCACALALAQAGVSDCVLIEASDYSQFRIGESIPPEALSLLQALNIDPAFLQENHLPNYGTRSWWGDERPGYNDTVMNPYGNGWHLDRCRFDKFLAEQVRVRGTSVLLNTQFVTSEVSDNGYVLTLNQGVSANKISHQLHADFVVDATGARSVFSRQQGSRQQKNLPLVVMAARFSAQEKKSEHAGLTQIEAVEHGWWYGAHLPDKSVLLAFYSDAATIKMLGLKQTKNWMALLSSSPNSARLLASSPEHLINAGINTEAVNIMGFSAPSYCLDQISGRHWLAIGDAASCWDPITSQGIVKAMASGISAAQFMVGELSQQQFTAGVQQTHQRYMAVREQFYRLEQRWPESLFWKKQQGWKPDVSDVF